MADAGNPTISLETKEGRDDVEIVGTVLRDAIAEMGGNGKGEADLRVWLDVHTFPERLKGSWKFGPMAASVARELADQLKKDRPATLLFRVKKVDKTGKTELTCSAILVGGFKILGK